MGDVDKPRLPAYARRVMRGLSLLFVCLLASSEVSAQAPAPALRSPRPPAQLRLGAPEARHAGRFAHAAAIVGMISAGLLAGGMVAIEWVDDPRSERVTRGVHLGYTALAAPFVALAAYSARRASKVVGQPRLRGVGWLLYTSAIASGVVLWYDALHYRESASSVKIIYGGLAPLSVLPHSFDAYVSGRQARIKALFLTLSPLGVRGRF